MVKLYTEINHSILTFQLIFCDGDRPFFVNFDH